MKKQVLQIALATGFLFGVGCQRTENVDPTFASPDSLTEKAARINSLAIATNCDVISFNNVAAGTLLSQITSEGGVVIPMKSYNSRSGNEPVAAMVFNSTDPHWEDKDLDTPNIKFGGKGVGIGGESGAYVNDTYLGNIAVIQNFIDFGQTPNDDDVKGYIHFDFSAAPVTATSLTVIDVETQSEGETGQVKLYSVKGGTLLHTAQMPDTKANGVGIVDLNNTANVGYIEVIIDGSIAIDNLRFCPTPKPGNQCSYTQGYWKTHGPDAKGNNKNEWNVSSLMLGNVSYTDQQLMSVFKTSVQGNGLISLAHQLIAAKLNIVEGTDASSIQTIVTQSDALIGSKVIPPVGNGFLTPDEVSGLVEKLTQYNEGVLQGGPKHCD